MPSIVWDVGGLSQMGLQVHGRRCAVRVIALLLLGASLIASEKVTMHSLSVELAQDALAFHDAYTEWAVEWNSSPAGSFNTRAYTLFREQVIPAEARFHQRFKELKTLEAAQ